MEGNERNQVPTTKHRDQKASTITHTHTCRLEAPTEVRKPTRELAEGKTTKGILKNQDDRRPVYILDMTLPRTSRFYETKKGRVGKKRTNEESEHSTNENSV